MNKHYKYIILGSGISGISAGNFLNSKDHIILEKSSHKGGLLYSYKKNDSTWDIGPHVSFTKYQLVKKIISKSFGKIKYESVIPYNFFERIKNNYVAKKI